MAHWNFRKQPARCSWWPVSSHWHTTTITSRTGCNGASRSWLYLAASTRAASCWPRPGCSSTLDLMLGLIGQAHGEPLAVQVSEQFVVSRIRTRLDHQRMQVASRYDLHNKKLVRVIGEMERQCEQPLSSEALAEQVGISE